MKKIIVPSVLCLAVFLVTWYCQTFTLLRQEGLGLFVDTPDFYRALFFDPLPISSLIGSFLVQFYCWHVAGVLIVTAMVLLSYVLVMKILGRLGVANAAFGAAGASIIWWFITRASSPALGTAMLMGLAVILAVLCPFTQRRLSPDSGWWSIGAAAGIVALTTVLITSDKQVRDVEKWAKVEFAAVQGDWDYLLKYANPEAARKDPNLVPYALMALNAKGELTVDRMAAYPLAENFGLDYGDEISYRSTLFDAVLYSNLGCPNEAIHRIHQSGDFLYHGTSFRTLRMLVKENYVLQDSLMVVKYCDILDRSLTHGTFVRYFRENPCRQRTQDTPKERSEAVLTVSKDQMETMLQLGHAGISSRMAMERYYGYYQLKQYFNGLKQKNK